MFIFLYIREYRMKIRYKNLFILVKMANRQKTLQSSLEKMKNYKTITHLLPQPKNLPAKNKDIR